MWIGRHSSLVYSQEELPCCFLRRALSQAESCVCAQRKNARADKSDLLNSERSLAGSHTAIREDASINLAAVADLRMVHPDLDLILIESGGDNLAATFSPELADLSIYVIDTAAGQDIPRKRGPGVTRSDLLVVNKTDLAPHVGVDLELLEADTRRARGERPYVMARVRQGVGVAEVVRFLETDGGLSLRLEPAVKTDDLGGGDHAATAS